MDSIIKIWTVTKYELKVLWRSWFFRIFSIIVIVILTLMTVGILTVDRNPWMLRGMPALPPLFCLKLLTIAQAIICIFLATDFLRRDRKYDSTEVVYMRSLTNTVYVTGKFLAVFILFFAQTILQLIITLIIHRFFSDLPFGIAPYFYSIFIINIPTIIFFIGFTFFLMTVLRNQAVTFILSLGYAAVALFYARDKLLALFDVFGFYIPTIYSDFIGYAKATLLWQQRGIYVLLGLFGMFMTIFYLKRLIQSRYSERVTGILAIISLLGAIWLGFLHTTSLVQIEKRRDVSKRLNKLHTRDPRVSIEKHHLALNHRSDHIDAQSTLVFRNKTSEPINQYLFSLNPGFVVDKVTQNGHTAKFQRKAHLLFVSPEKPLAPNSADSLTIAYSGKIDPSICYLKTPAEERNSTLRMFFFRAARQYAFQTSDFVLFTPETVWYPTAGLPTGASFPIADYRDFTRFTLTVETSASLTALSQGASSISESNGRNTTTFIPENPLPQISLIIGKYNSYTIDVDSVTYSLNIHPGHNYFEEYFSEISDTLESLIRNARNDLELSMGSDYPFKRLSLIEVPMQFTTHKRLWTLAREVTQPEQVLLPEFGIYMRTADFMSFKSRNKRRLEHSNQTETELESQTNMFNWFVNSTFKSFNTLNPRFGAMNVDVPSYSIIPNFYSYRNHITSANWPVFNTALESYLFNKAGGDQGPPFWRMLAGMTSAEKSNVQLRKHSLQTLLMDSTLQSLHSSILAHKGNYLLKYIKNKVGAEIFDDFIIEILQHSEFDQLNEDDFIKELNKRTDFDFSTHFREWYEGTEMAGFLVGNVDGYKVLDGDRTRFQVLLKITNAYDAEGLVTLSFRPGGGGGPGFPGRGGRPEDSETVTRIVHLNGNETKKIGVLLDDPIRGFELDTGVSVNLPSLMSYRLERMELNEKAKPFDGEEIVDTPVLFETAKNEWIIDNESEAFNVQTQEQQTLVKQFISRWRTAPLDTFQYIGLNYWRPPRSWSATKYSNFYGKFIHSAYYIRKGDGTKKVEWAFTIPESGNYDVYTYMPRIDIRMRRGRGGRRRSNSYTKKYQYFVHHDDGVDEVLFDTEASSEGWNLLGSYYFSAGETKVELSNLSEGRFVVADAVKFVKR